MLNWELCLKKGAVNLTNLFLSLVGFFLMLSVFCFTFSADVCIYYYLFDKFKHFKLVFDDLLLGGPRPANNQ